jgi:hypothetical protein
MTDKRPFFVILTAILGILAIPIISFAYENSKTACVTQPITFQNTEVANTFEYIGVDTVTVQGIDGIREICKREKSGQLVSDKVVQQPVNQVLSKGTKEKPVYKPITLPTYQSSQSGSRTGAICRDGWRSSATGSGACSHHGGVGHWLY